MVAALEAVALTCPVGAVQSRADRRRNEGTYGSGNVSIQELADLIATAARSIRIHGIVFALLLPAVLSSAQTGTAVFLGTVTDQQGALLPNVHVTVTNAATGIGVSTTTDAGGSYRIAGLFPGDYNLKAERPSFSSEVQQGVTLAVSQEAVVNFTLGVGPVTQTFVIDGSQAPLVETQESSISG
jgi:Carboxypeptidase regulatory-like domain